LFQRITLAASIAALALLASAPARGEESPRCRSACAPQLRECLQEGRPGLRACLRDCRAAASTSCPPGLDIEDCPEAADLRACVTLCRDARRKEIRACVQDGVACNRGCAHPGPTPTATPRA